MGCIYCELCDEALGLPPAGSPPHVCDPATLLTHVRWLREGGRKAARHQDEVETAILMLTEPLHPDAIADGEAVTVDGAWVRRLWELAGTEWYGATSPESFLVRWIALHRLLGATLDVFWPRPGMGVEDRLGRLRESAEAANNTLGYGGSRMSLTVGGLLAQVRDRAAGED